MEDSLEHYIQMVRNTKVENKSKESSKYRNIALITLQKQKECEARAVKIVQFLIEGKLRPEVFLRCLRHINQAYYQDVVQERAITNLCGYSLCGNQIPKMPKKQYFINTKNNKVYDITDRKNYCSNFCYKASVHIKQQIDTSPLWLRKLEDCPEFNLLPTTERGSPGEEISQGIAKPVSEVQFTSVTEFADVSLRDLGDMEVIKPKEKNKQEKPKMETVEEVDENLAIEASTIVESEPTPSKATQFTEKTSECSLKKIEHDQELKDGNSMKTNEEKQSSLKTTKNSPKVVKHNNKLKDDSKETNEDTREKKKPKDLLEIMKKYIHEWITIDTYIYLYGEEKIRTAVKDNVQLQEYFENLKEKEVAEIQRRKYISICKKLKLTQLADEKFDREVTSNGQFKPIPDYKELKEESKTMNLKVRSFYSGEGYNLENNEKTVYKEESVQEENTTKVENIPAVLPLLDNNSQNALRRKIYLNSVSKAVINLTQNLGIPSHYVTEELRPIVRTFKLEAHNVVLQPSLLNLTAIILLKLLGIRDNNLKAKLETAKSKAFLSIMLNKLANSEASLCELFKNIENFNMFIEQFFSSNS